MRSVTLRSLAVVLAMVVVVAGAARAQGKPADVAHRFFASVSAQDYVTAWALLTRHTQDDLLNVVSLEAKSDPAALRKSFDEGDASSRKLFWDEFRTSSKSDVFASKVFVTQSEDGPKAVVRAGDIPANLLMLNEGGQWKLGLEETFFPQGFGIDPTKG